MPQPSGRSSTSRLDPRSGAPQQAPVERARVRASGPLVCLLVLIGIAPLWYGGATPGAWAFNAVLAGALAIWLGFEAGNDTWAIDDWPLEVRIAAWLVIAVLVWAAIQALPIWPPPIQHPVWSMSREIAGTTSGTAAMAWASISISPERTLVAIARLLTTSLVFILAFLLSRRADAASRIVMTIAVTCVVYALYGYSDLILGSQRVLFTPKDPYAVASYGNYLSATFINRNHYAGYAGLGFAVALAMLLVEISKQSHKTGERERPYARRRLFRKVIGALPKVAPAVVMAITLLLSVMLSGSRAGLFALLIGLALGLLLLGIRSGRLVASAVFGVLIIGLVVVLLLGAAGDGAGLRLGRVGEHFASRADVYAATWNAIWSAPLTGHGYGTFVDMLPLYRDGTLREPGFWNAAHNDYLETAAGLGLPATFALLGAIALMIWRAAVGAVSRRRDALAPFAATLASAQLAFHSLLDFPLQLDGVALPFAALLGAGVAQSWRTDEQKSRASNRVA